MYYQSERKTYAVSSRLTDRCQHYSHMHVVLYSLTIYKTEGPFRLKRIIIDVNRLIIMPLPIKISMYGSSSGGN